VLHQGWAGPGGHVAGQPAITSLTEQHPSGVRWLAQHGYTWWATYQPESRFWHFQLIEGSWLLALSLILIIATIWLVRRRAA